MKYDLKGHIRSNKGFYVYSFSSNNSNNCMLRRKLRLGMILKLGFMWPLLCYGKVTRFKKNAQIF